MWQVREAQGARRENVGVDVDALNEGNRLIAIEYVSILVEPWRIDHVRVAWSWGRDGERRVHKIVQECWRYILYDGLCVPIEAHL